MLGKEVAMPVGIAPSAMQKLVHPDGECGTANASQAAGTLMILSTLCTTSLEEIRRKAPKAILWLQLYVFKNRRITEELIRRAECANLSAIVLTVDAPTWGQRIADVRNAFNIPENLSLANFRDTPHIRFRKANGSGLTKYTEDFFDPSLTWDDVTWLKNATTLPVILKGIITAEDAELAVHRGVDAIIVSNHGGRQLDGSPAAVEALSEVVDAVRGRIEVYVDGGVRRGTDVIKALALGARAVFVGRPALWGLAYDGERGVKKMLEIFYNEINRALALMGHKSVQDLRPNDVVRQERCAFRTRI
ncbi:2-Hydroxyacid oxidase 1-like [Haemaphysalis longicornis]